MKKHIITIHARQILDMDRFIAFWKDHKDGEYELQTRNIRKRSLDQNAYYWGVVVPMCRAALYQAGWEEIRTNDDAHEFMLRLHNVRTLHNERTGDKVDVAIRSHELSIPEFQVYLARIIQWAAIYLGIYIPDPNEPLAELDQYIQNTDPE